MLHIRGGELYKCEWGVAESAGTELPHINGGTFPRLEVTAVGGTLQTSGDSKYS